MEKFVNAMGDACPIPVVKTKEAIRALAGQAGRVTTAVDNEIAVQNLTKMAEQKGYGVASQKISEDRWEVTMTIGEASAEAEETAVCAPTPAMPQGEKNTVVVISSNVMGSGDDVLGRQLMKAFLFALAQQEHAPKTLLFYNGGAFLTCEGSASLEDIITLQERGTEVLTCGTCLNHYGIADTLQVGGVTNMYDIVEKQLQADLVVRP